MINIMTYIPGDAAGRLAGAIGSNVSGGSAAGGKQGGSAAGTVGVDGRRASYAEVESSVTRPDPPLNEPARADGRTRVFGNPVDLANAQKYMRPDRYVFIDSTAAEELPGEGDIVLGNAPAKAGAMRIAGENAAETEKAIWDTMVSLGANRGSNYGSLSTLYITGDIPELHREPGMEPGYTAYPGNIRYTPEEWLENLENYKLLSGDVSATRVGPQDPLEITAGAEPSKKIHIAVETDLFSAKEKEES